MHNMQTNPEALLQRAGGMFDPHLGFSAAARLEENYNPYNTAREQKLPSEFEFVALRTVQTTLPSLHDLASPYKMSRPVYGQ
jgi:hypothetical protein